MIFESIAAVTAAISGINSLVSAVKEGNANVNSILDRMTGIQDGMNKLEIEKRESITQPLSPQEAMKLAMAKQSIDRYNEELRLLCHMSVEGEKFWQNYQNALKESKERHAASVRAIIAKKKARKQFLQDLFLYSTVGIIGLMIAAIVITLVIFAFRP
jgi:hypothetical protein